MRLMPPPLALPARAPTPVFDARPALVTDSRIELFYATNRLPVGPRDNRALHRRPDRRLHLGTATLRIGDEASTLDQLCEWSTGAGPCDRPFIHLERMAEAATVARASPGAEAAAWLAEIDAALAASRSSDILVYVHGANTTVERAAGQAAQLRHFAGREAVVVLFAWPTAENFLRYPRDIETAFGGAPHLADLIALLAERTSAEKIDVFTYSAGATVGSDALARVARDDPPPPTASARSITPPRTPTSAASSTTSRPTPPHARRVTTAVNLGDSALRLAAAVNRASRAGRPDLARARPRGRRLAPRRGGGDELEILQVQPGDHARSLGDLAYLLVRRPLGQQRRARSPCSSTCRPATAASTPDRRLGRALLDLSRRLSGARGGARAAAHPRASRAG